MVETNIKNLVINKMTQAQYDALEEKDPNQLYYIVDDDMYVDVARLAVEIDAGKQLISDAINEKGGTASADESLSELAEDITNTIIAEDFLKKFLEGTSPYDGGTFTSDIEYLATYKLFAVPFTEINMLNLTDFDQYNFRSCPNLRVLRLPSFAPVSITNADYFLASNSALEELYLDSFNYNVVWFMRYSALPLKKIYAPNWRINFNTTGPYAWFGQYASGQKVLEDLTIKSFSGLNSSSLFNFQTIRKITLTEAPTADINMRYLWVSDNVIAEGQSGIDELNANVQALADSFLDYTGLTAKIITFNANLYNVLTAETKQKFTDKNWAVAYA